MSIYKKINDIFDSSIQEVTFKSIVKKDPKTANLSGQAKLPGDKEAEEKMKTGNIELEDIVEKINAIRAGHSLKDPNIAIALETYFTDLDIAERTALFAYLKGISEIISGQKQPEIAAEPSDPDPDVKMIKGNDKKEEEKAITKKANVVVKHNRGGGEEVENKPIISIPIEPKF